MADQDDDETTTVERESSPSFHFALPSAPHAFSAQPQKIILIAVITTGMVSLIEHTAGAKAPAPGAKPVKTASVATILVGTFVSGALLLGLSYFLPEFAGGLALVMLVTTIFERGTPFWTVVGQVTGKTSTAGAYGTDAAGQAAAASNAAGAPTVGAAGDVQAPQLAPLPSSGSSITRIGRAN